MHLRSLHMPLCVDHNASFAIQPSQQDLCSSLEVFKFTILLVQFEGLGQF